MPKRKIKRRRGEGITIDGPATIHVSRRVTLIVEAPAAATLRRISDRSGRDPAQPPSD